MPFPQLHYNYQTNCFFVLQKYYPFHATGTACFFQFFSHATEAGHNQKKNLPLTTHSILLPTVVQIKGSPIHPLVGSCSGYRVIPHFHGLDRCSRHCIDPASKNAGFLLARTVRLLSCCAHPPSAWVLTFPPHPSMAGGDVLLPQLHFLIYISHN